MFCLYVWNIWIKTDHIHIEVLVLILIFLLTREYLANKVTYPPILLVFYNKTVMKTRRVIIRHSSYCSGISLGLPCVRSVLRCYHTGTITTVTDWTISSCFYCERTNITGFVVHSCNVFAHLTSYTYYVGQTAHVNQRLFIETLHVPGLKPDMTFWKRLSL